MSILEQLEREFAISPVCDDNIVCIHKHAWTIRRMQNIELSIVKDLVKIGYSKELAIVASFVVAIDDVPCWKIFGESTDLSGCDPLDPPLDTRLATAKKLCTFLSKSRKPSFLQDMIVEYTTKYPDTDREATDTNKIKYELDVTGDPTDAPYAEALSNSPNLRRLVHICIRLGRLPTERAVKNLTHNQIKLLFYAIREDEERWTRRFEKILGTYWEYNDIFPPSGAPGSEASKAPTCIRLPLAVGFRPELLKNLRQVPIAPKDDKVTVDGSGIIEAADLPKSEFLDLMKSAMSASSDLRKKRRQETEETAVEKILNTDGSVQRLAMDRLEQRRKMRTGPTEKPIQRNPPQVTRGCPTCIRTPGQCPIHNR